MKEEFLHYLWRTKRFNIKGLQTTSGAPVSILKFGQYNENAGPDFLNAHIRIGDTEWAGNIEMHLLSSDWYRHRHQGDSAYQNVILHVVLEDDRPVQLDNGQWLPTLELKRHIPPGLSAHYQRLEENAYWIPCAGYIQTVDDFIKKNWLDRLAVERLEAKTAYVDQLLEWNNHDWEETYFQVLARCFGLKVNAEPMELVARSIPLIVLLKHKSSLIDMESLLLGQAGLLEEEFEEDYPNRLKKDYEFFRKKYRVTPISKTYWKFSRMRPANFPTVRLAQLARLYYQTNYLFSKTLAAKNASELTEMLRIEISNYWWTHYVFDKPSRRIRKKLGKNAIQLILINGIAPILFLYGMKKKDNRLKDKALRILQELPPEKNKIISQWEAHDLKAQSAYDTQAMLELKKNYCDKRKCLSCAIGDAVLKKG